MCIACTPVNKYFAKEHLFVFKLVENTVHLSSKILIQINLILKRKKKRRKNIKIQSMYKCSFTYLKKPVKSA